jgi:exodeoxyribonuclease VII large subunit
VLNDVLVAGEVSNVNRPASGHTYFTLKDGTAQLRCVLFARRYGPPQAYSSFVQNGNAVLAHGRIALYEARGDLQLSVDFVQPEGAGALQAEFERLKVKLEEQGLFDESRKRPLPRYPRRIGVVTSATGAVFQDICRVLERRWPVAEVVLAPAPVQGPDAVPGIIGGIESLNAEPDIDVLIAGRGGGGIEELWAFNDEHVARGARLAEDTGRESTRSFGNSSVEVAAVRHAAGALDLSSRGEVRVAGADAAAVSAAAVQLARRAGLVPNATRPCFARARR